MTKNAWEEFVGKHPLAKFSYYLNGRVWVLQEIGDEILENLDNVIVDCVIIHERLSRAEMLFWLWSLGAYEVMRTMHQASDCFTESIRTELFALKRELAQVRMPSAKMEKMGQRVPVPSTRSATGFDTRNKDMLVGDPDDHRSARELLRKFTVFFNSLEDDDIFSPHESSYEK